MSAPGPVSEGSAGGREPEPRSWSSGAIAPGLCSVTFRQLSPEEVIDVTARAALGHIEWGADVHVRPGEVGVAEGVGRRCRQAGVAAASYGSYLTAGRLDRTEAERGSVAANLDAAAALGAANVRVWAVGDGAADDLAAICEKANERDLAVSVEYHPGTATETAAGTLELLAAVGAGNLFTYWQPDPALGAGDQLRDLAAVAHRLSHLHVFAWRADRTRLPLGAGLGLWPPAFALLGRSRLPTPPGPTRVAFLEFVQDDDPDRLVADAAVLRGWLEDQP